MHTAASLAALVGWVIAAGGPGCAGQAPLAPRAVELNRAGLDALEAGDLATAEARFAVALEYHPRFVEAQVNLGLTELARGNHEHARALFLRARRINADLPHPHHGLGVLADKEGRAAEAASYYREALRIDPGFVPARANLSRAYFDAGMLDEAREQFLRLEEVAPGEDRGPVGLAETLLRMNRRPEAREVVERALARIGPTPPLLLLRARELLEDGEVTPARRLLGALAIHPGAHGPAFKSWLSVADVAAGDLDAAQRNAEAALGEDRREPVATYVLSIVLEARRDLSAPAWRARVRRAVGR